MADPVGLSINGKPQRVAAGTTVAVALAQAGVTRFRRAVTGASRGPLCGMGICFECRVTIDGQAHRRSCVTLCTPGMEVWTDD